VPFAEADELVDEWCYSPSTFLGWRTKTDFNARYISIPTPAVTRLLFTAVSVGWKFTYSMLSSLSQPNEPRESAPSRQIDQKSIDALQHLEKKQRCRLCLTAL